MTHQPNAMLFAAEQAVDSSSLPDSANFENRPIDEGCMGRTSGVQLQKGSSSQVGNLGNRLGSTDSMTDAQRARTRSAIALHRCHCMLPTQLLSTTALIAAESCM